MTSDAILAELRATAPRAPEALRERVLARAPAKSVRAFGAPRRLVLVLPAAALAAVVAAAVVDGVVGSGSSPRQSAASQSQGTSGATAGPNGRVHQTPRAGQATPQDQTFSAKAAPLRAVAPSPVPGTNGRLTDVQASMRVRVDDLDALGDATAEAQRVVRRLGGYVQSVDYTAPRGRPGVSYLELRVPVSHVQDALLSLSALGTVLDQQVSTQDLQALVDRQNAQIASLRREITRLVLTLKTPLPPDTRIRLQLQLDEAKQALAARTHARRSTVRRGSLAKVSLQLTTEHAAGAVHQRGRFGRALHGALGFLAAAGAVALVAVVALSPLLVLAAVWLVAARLWRRREERRLLTA